MLSVQRIGRTLPESRFIHLIRDGRDVALSQRARALNEQPPPAEQAERWVKRIRKSREQAQRAEGRPLRRGPLRGPRPRPRDDPAADLRVHRPALGRRRAAATTSAPRERLEEMAGELRAEGTHATQQAGYRIDNHAPTTKPPDPSKLDKWRTRDDRGGRGAPTRASPARCSAELGYEVSVADARRNRHQVVQPRAGVRLPLRPRRARRARPRDLHPRPPDQGQGRDGGAHRPHRRLGSARRHRGVASGRCRFDEYERWIADNELEVVHWDNCYQHEEIAQLRDSGRAGRSAASSGRCSRPRTPSRRSAPTTSSTR